MGLNIKRREQLCRNIRDDHEEIQYMFRKIVDPEELNDRDLQDVARSLSTIWLILSQFVEK